MADQECAYRMDYSRDPEGESIAVCPECFSKNIDDINDHDYLCNDCEATFVCP